MHLSSGGSDGNMSTSRAVGQLIGKVLMVPPKHFTVKYAINPWMGGVVDKSRANDQWNQLKSAIERAGVRVLTMEQAPDQPDMVFVCNSGIVLGNKVDKTICLKCFHWIFFRCIWPNFVIRSVPVNRRTMRNGLKKTDTRLSADVMRMIYVSKVAAMHALQRTTNYGLDSVSAPIKR
jgi:hypothetical protein